MEYMTDMRYVKKTRSGEKRWIIDVLLLNIVFRIVWIIVVNPPQKADFLWYFQHAKMLASGGGYHWLGHTTAYWPIGWPFFLSLVYRITGPSVFIGLTVNVLLSTCIVYLVYRVSLLLFHRRDVSLWAAIAYSILPSQVEWNDVLGSEELFTTLLLLAVLVYIYNKRRPNGSMLRFTALSGMILGLAADVRPIPLLFPVFVFAYELWIYRASVWQSIQTSLVLAACMLSAIAPVTIRNAVAMHHFILVSTNGGTNLWQGTHTNGGYFWSWNKNVNPLLGVKNEILKNQIATHAAVNHILHHIPGTVGNGFLKIFDLYKADVNSTWYTFHMIPSLKGWTAPVDAVNTTVYFLLMACFGIGIAFVLYNRTCTSHESCNGSLHDSLHGSWKDSMFLMTFVVYNTCFFFFFPAWDRFRYPAMPLFAVFAGVGIWVVVRATGSAEKALPRE